MFTEELKLIRESENRAEEIKKNSKAEAREIVEKAKQEAAEILKGAETEGRLIYQKLVDEGEAEAAAQYKAEMDKLQEELEALAVRAEENRAAAVKFIKERVESGVNS